MSDQGYEPTQVGQPAVPTGAMPTQVGYGTGGPPPPGYGGGMPPGPGGFPPPPDRRAWIIGGLIAAIVVVILAIVLVSSGSGDDSDVATDGSTTSSSATSSSSTSSSSTSSSSSSSTSSTSSTTATTTPPATTTTTEAPPVTVNPATCSAAGDNQADPGAAAQTVYDAWTRGDTECARVLMTNAAFNRLFQNDGREAQFEFAGCDDDPDNPEIDKTCSFFTEGTGMNFLMIFSDTDGWLVTDVVQIAD
jgi:hypothetical protein